MQRSPVELVLFDFDGTLVDTAPDLIRATNLYLESKGLEALPEAVIRSQIGMGLRKLITDLYPDAKTNEAVKRQIEGEFMAVYEREFLFSPQLFPGALEFLMEWEGAVGIVSNKRARFIRPILEKLGILNHPWVAVVGGDTYTNMKPHPEPLLEAMALAGVAPENTLLVGDGHPDVEGAINAGCRVAAVEFGYTPIEELMELGAHYRLEDFASLHKLIRSISL